MMDISEALERDVPGAICVRGRPGRMPLLARMALHNTPGLSVAIVDGDDVSCARGFGALSMQDAAPVTARTLFQAASIGKPVAAFAAMILADRGSLDLDADVNDVLSSWRVPAGPVARGEHVTPRRLMSHTAGLSMQSVWGYTPGEPLPSIVQMLDGAPPTNERVCLIAEPGTEFRYSGGGYTVLQLLISELAGRPFEEFARDAIFEPCGMRDSTFAQPLPEALAGSAARGHTQDGAPLPGGWTVLPGVAAGGLWSTASDLARFVIETQRALDGRSRLLSRAMAAEMLAPQPLGPAALGFWLQGDGDAARFFHTGANLGYRAHAVGYRSRARGAVVMTNGDGGGSICLGLLNRIAELCDWPQYITEKQVAAVDPSVLDRYVGEYEIAGMVAVLERDGDTLTATVPMFNGGALYPESQTQFFFSDADGGVTFEPGDHGAMSVTVRIAGLQLKGARR